MKRRNVKKFMSYFLTLALFTSMAPIYASDTLPYLGDGAKGVYQPYQHGYRAEDLLNWSPETDPYAELLRANVPLQNRNAALQATQANPNLNPNTQMLTLAGDYGNAFFDSYPYTNEFSQYLFNFWQYTDIYASWHGMPTEGVSEDMYIDERGVSDAWQQRKFEFGLINLPNPGYTNAAHKNGALSLGCIFLPRTGLKHTKLLTQDEKGNFPYANKLIEMCEYYGFDGWFINQEEDIPVEDVTLYKAFMQQLRDGGLYIQWYDSVINEDGTIEYQNEFTPKNSPFVIEDGKQYSDSIFLNYWWDHDKLTNSYEHALELGIDPLETVFVGVEAGMYRWNQNQTGKKFYDLRYNLGDNGQPMNAIATLGAEFVQSGLDEDFDNGANDNIAMRREKDEFQWMVFDRERTWWSGPYGDPSKATSTGDRSDYPQTTEIGIGTRGTQVFDGVAAYIAERSVISGDTFVTNFNTGHGLEYVVDGVVSNDNEWSNIGIQDILPTWQWRVDTDGTRLNIDFDYGTEYKRNLDNGKEDVLGKESSFDFDLVGAYNGGSSLVVNGKLDSKNTLHLYKTDLDVNKESKMDITFKKSSNDTASMSLGIIFEDDTDTVVEFSIPNSENQSNDWITSTVDLSAYKGKKIASFGLIFDGVASDYQVNIGQMKYTSDKAIQPATPKNLTIDKAYETKEMIISWDMESYDKVQQYNVYALNGDKEVYLGGVYDNIFYVKDLKDIISTQSPLTLQVKAVSKDGTESLPATLTFDYNNTVSNIQVTAIDGELNATWDGGQADVVVIKEYTNDAVTYTASGDGKTTVKVPTGKDANGARYSMQITKLNGDTITYDGTFNDNYCQPYEGTVCAGRLEVPLSKDWYKMTSIVTLENGEVIEDVAIRYQKNMLSIPDGAKEIKVTLEDYNGNVSEPTTISLN